MSLGRDGAKEKRESKSEYTDPEKIIRREDCSQECKSRDTDGKEERRGSSKSHKVFKQLGAG